MLGALQLIASKQGDPAESGAGGMEGETDAAGGGGHFGIEGEQKEFGDFREEAVKNKEMTGVSGTQAEGAVETFI